MNMRILKKALALICTLTMVLSLAGCGDGAGETKTGDGEESKVIQVKFYKAGYGEEWLQAMIKAFEEAYKEEGYKVEIVESSSTISTSSEQEILLGPGKNKTDLYFTSGVSVSNVIDSSKKVLRTEDEVLLESLEDIFRNPAIGADKKEEEKTIEERLFPGLEESLHYRGANEKWQSDRYTIPWALGATGLVMNNSIMEKYGLDIPLTSNEFAAVLETIEKKGEADAVHPYSWSGNNAPGYWTYLYDTWFAQYSGAEAYNNFWATNPASGDVRSDGWQVYEDQGILEALKAMDKIMDLDYSADGSVNMTHLEAQHELLTGKAAFMVSGDWMLNEMKNEYYEEASQVSMLKAPVLSVIGEEIGISDAQLHTVVEMIDNGSDAADIKAAVSGLTDEGLSRVQNARNAYSSIGVTHQILVPSYSDAKTAVKAFLRFMYSEDGCRIFREQAYSLLPISTSETEEAPTVFQKSIEELTGDGQAVALFQDSEASQIRAKSGMLPFNYSAFAHPNTFRAMMTDEKITAEYIYDTELAYVKANWATYVSYAGE